MEKYSLEAKELLSESQMFEVKAGAVVKDHLQQECSLCDSCIGCASRANASNFLPFNI